MRVRISAGQDIYLFQNVAAGTGVHPASSSVGKETLLARSARQTPHLHLVPQLKGPVDLYLRRLYDLMATCKLRYIFFFGCGLL
jgi:hypothetical protein